MKSEHKISIIHFNSRSLYANFHSIKEYLSQFKIPFNIIAVSETWIKNEKGTDFELDGYEFNYINRKNKNGGGVAIYIDNNLKYKLIGKMTEAVDDLLECITVEICFEKMKNITVTCIYRSPGSNIQVFREWMENMLINSTQKVFYICGDFNIDLLNAKKHKMTM